MTGLEKILDEIKAQSRQTVEQIESEGRKIADDMIKEQEEKISSKKAVFEKELEQTSKLDLEKGISSAISQKKKMILEEKQNIISDIIEKSKNYIKNLSKDEYMTFLEKIALKYAHKEEGKIRLTASDKDGIGQELVSRLNTKLSENSKGTLVLDDQVSNEKSGFVIIYKDVEENCSLEAIFSEKRELLEDKINSFLFN
ncbi:MAG: V-type ATP synthase subunit E [Peptoanaerobacter stomatis]|uniref:V-type ATP synthase subunit E n=1 Tax=Peptoanaerobacter stomatis TaxID=796937 RepID=UPI003FA041CB